MRVHLIVVGVLLAIFFGRGWIAAAELVDVGKLDALVGPLVDDGWVQGLAIGLVNPRGTQTIGYGRISDDDDAPPNADTVFEIGSITKVFTGLLLAIMVEERAVDLNDPVQKLLGDSMRVPKGQREITLADLVTHSSGLPRMPGNFLPKDPRNPYADYTVEQLGKFISDYKLSREPGAQSQYSNLGMGLLGHALAMRGGMTYETLVRKRICEPLGMNDTRIALDDAIRVRLAQGHNANGKTVDNWDIPTLAGAGAMRSTVADMLKFLAANAGLTKTPLTSAIDRSHEIHFKDTQSPNNLALAWHVRKNGGLIWHNGQTGGYHSFAGFRQDKRLGVVVLCNTAAMQVDALGVALVELLDGGEAQPLKLPKREQPAN